MATEERRKETGTELEGLYKTKVVQFLGRSIPIILQNDNGPCPLIAISNVLLLRNNLNLSLETTEIPLQKLLSLVAERLIDSNSNVEDKDAGYVKNQQQNIADAIDMLPRLATGIDVNLHFRKIDDFEFTPERAIFDLLGIELYHGWIIDPQDTDTLAAIGSKSYNTIIGELVSLETRNAGGEQRNALQDDCVDFAAATTATLGVPSPTLSRGRSFGDSPISVNGDQRARKGDLEEEEVLVRVLQLSRDDAPPPSQLGETLDPNCSGSSTSPDESAHIDESLAGIESNRSHQSELDMSQNSYTGTGFNDDGLPPGILSQESDNLVTEFASGNHQDQSNCNESGESFMSSDLVQATRTDILVQNQTEPFIFPNRYASAASFSQKDHIHSVEEDCANPQMIVEDASMSLNNLKLDDNQSNGSSTFFLCSSSPNIDSDSTAERTLLLDVSEDVSSSLSGSEPLYEGEECILDSGNMVYENREPMYEGEMILAEQSDRATGDSCGPISKDENAEEQSEEALRKGELIRNFLKNNASQLTIYGLFCLQEGLKERELCVFFRNNHFSTMFKFNGELYLLATDQGYINQPDLVWEKLNEVNGDSVFMTGNFKEFKAENQGGDSWDEHNAMSSTADYLASIDNSGQEGSTLNSDLQLAIALQQQEFEQQPQRQSAQNSQQSSLGGHSRLVTGPQRPSGGSNNNSPKQDAKSKDKCALM